LICNDVTSGIVGDDRARKVQDRKQKKGTAYNKKEGKEEIVPGPVWGLGSD